MLRRRQVWVAHAEVDDVTARLTRCVPHRVYFGDDIGRQALDAVEFVFHDLDTFLLMLRTYFRVAHVGDKLALANGC